MWVVWVWLGRCCASLRRDRRRRPCRACVPGKELTLPSLSDTVSAFGLAVSLPSQQPSIVPGRRARRLVIVEQLF